MRAAIAVFRAERHGLRALAAHADRALRTHAARRCAAGAYEVARHGRDLDSRPAWTQLDASQYVCAFGGRKAMLTVPHVVRPQEYAAMIARMEVRVLLGDEPELVLHLQAYATRELDRLFSAA